MICSQCGHAPPEQLETLPEATLTRITELLASNVAPHGTEKAELSELMSRTQAYDIALDTRIAELHASLEDLLAQKTQTKQRLLDIQTILHPKRYIPPEILADIFDHAVSDAADTPLDTVGNGTFADSLKMSAPHWVVSHVCSHWRRTALTTPRIWRFVHVSFDLHPTNLSTRMFLDYFLRLSGQHTLHVMAHSRNVHVELAILLLSSHRWRTAAVSFQSSVYRSWNAAHLTFTALTKLHVHIQLPMHIPLSEGTGSSRYPCVLIRCPQLRVLSTDTPAAFIVLFALSYAEAPIAVFEQPDCLDVDLRPMRSVSHVAPAMIITQRSLHSAQFHLTNEVSMSFYDKWGYNDIREYPNMRVLRLSGTHKGRAHFFSKFTFPRLEVLSFDDVVKGFDDGDVLSFPAPLISPTGQDLKTLKVSLDADPCERRKLIAFLRTTPVLCHLELTFRALLDIDLTIKSILVDEQGLIPALSRLIIVGKQGVDISLDFVQSITQRRFSAGKTARLDEVVVDYVVYVDEHVEAAFNALLSDGLTGTLKGR
ncbi:hypothetical protein BDZ89DRAFT_114673 [Hymenopellis radicata]|nr:hypothetical protein BDZ89DRAFT_114673 [Hymenopellis radicata]